MTGIPLERKRREVGWYELRSGHPFHGPIPDDATVIDEPAPPAVEPAAVAKPRKQAAKRSAAQPRKKKIDPGESSTTVRADVPGVDLGAQPEQVPSGPPVSGSGVEENNGDSHVVGHPQESTETP